MRISYDSSELIEDLHRDLAEFGANHLAHAVFLEKFGEPILVNYLVSADKPPTNAELEGGTSVLLPLSKILKICEEQNRTL